MPRNPSHVRLEEKFALRINDAVAISGLSRSTLYKLASLGKLRLTRVGGRTLVLRADLEALLQAGVAE